MKTWFHDFFYLTLTDPTSNLTQIASILLEACLGRPKGDLLCLDERNLRNKTNPIRV